VATVPTVRQDGVLAVPLLRAGNTGAVDSRAEFKNGVYWRYQRIDDGY
jgi:hypothetical protein